MKVIILVPILPSRNKGGLEMQQVRCMALSRLSINGIITQGQVRHLESPSQGCKDTSSKPSFINTSAIWFWKLLLHEPCKGPELPRSPIWVLPCS